MSSDPQDRPDAQGEPPLDVLTLGRSGVDIYPLQVGVGLDDVKTFGKYLGGTTANVAVAAARLGRRAAIITGVGDDPFGRYVRRALRELSVDDRYVVTNREYPTPVTFCEIFPPDDFPIWFYRKPTAPDLQIKPSDIDYDAVQDTALMWMSVTGLSDEPSRQSHFAVLEARDRSPLPSSIWTTARCSGRVRPPPPSRSARSCPRSRWRLATAKSARSRSGKPIPIRLRTPCSTPVWNWRS